jgi:glycosyltransferase involved in cell wall biosynthesis
VHVAKKLDLAALRRLAAMVEARGIDTVVATNTYATLYAVLLRALTSRPLRIVAVYHTTALHTRKQRLAMAVCRHAFSRCDLLIYVCENQRRFWRARGLRARADAVVHNGIDTRHFRDTLDADEKQALRRRLGFESHDYVIGLCAALRPEKAHEDLLKAVAALRARGLPARALLIGDGPRRQAIERTAAGLGIAEHVRITGFQSDVRPYIAVCDVVTLVSHAIETFSLAALEAMACGKPLVMTDIGGASEQIVHGVHGWLYRPGDIEALTTHLASLADARQRSEMGAAAAERVRASFTVERMVAAFERHLAALAAKRSRKVSDGLGRSWTV